MLSLSILIFFEISSGGRAPAGCYSANPWESPNSSPSKVVWQ
jgi:hypothetical protein